jgi:hypothetical protein
MVERIFECGLPYCYMAISCPQHSWLFEYYAVPLVALYLLRAERVEIEAKEDMEEEKKVSKTSTYTSSLL